MLAAPRRMPRLQKTDPWGPKNSSAPRLVATLTIFALALAARKS
jgi:hypothetical protein